MREDKIEFDFSRAITCIKADMQGINGIKMVDFIIEEEDRFIFIEIKDPDDKEATEQDRLKYLENMKDGKLSWELGQKYKDSILYKWACDEFYNKPVVYIVILEAQIADPALLNAISDKTRGYLPFGLEKQSNVKRQIISRFALMTLDKWNMKFKKYQAVRVNSESNSYS